MLDARLAILNLLGAAGSPEALTEWERTAPLQSRLQRDLQRGAVSAPNEELRKKIRPFPGNANATDGRSRFKVGARVSHPSFGAGRVIGSLDRFDTVSVLFDEHGPKKILADAAGFKALDE